MLEPLLIQQLQSRGPVGRLHDQHPLDAVLGIIGDPVPVGPSEGVLPLSDPPQDGIVCGTPEGGGTPPTGCT